MEKAIYLLYSFSLLTALGLAGLNDLLFLKNWGVHNSFLILFSCLFILASILPFFIKMSRTALSIYLTSSAFSYTLFSFLISGKIFLPAFFISLLLFIGILIITIILIKKEGFDISVIPKLSIPVIVITAVVFFTPHKYKEIKIKYGENLPEKTIIADITCPHCRNALKNYENSKLYNLNLILVPRGIKHIKENEYVYCAKDKKKALYNALKGIYEPIHCNVEDLENNHLIAVKNGIKRLPVIIEQEKKNYAKK